MAELVNTTSDSSPVPTKNSEIQNIAISSVQDNPEVKTLVPQTLQKPLTENREMISDHLVVRLDPIPGDRPNLSEEWNNKLTQATNPLLPEEKKVVLWGPGCDLDKLYRFADQHSIKGVSNDSACPTDPEAFFPVVQPASSVPELPSAAIPINKPEESNNSLLLPIIIAACILVLGMLLGGPIYQILWPPQEEISPCPQCTRLNSCHHYGQCDPKTRSCITSLPFTDGTVCDETAPICQINPRCVAGSCVFDPKPCPLAPTQCHSDSYCDPTTGDCVIPPFQPKGFPCNHSDPCVRSAFCNEGDCVGEISCPKSNDCEVCEGQDGKCVVKKKADGTPCFKNACTENSTCSSGYCEGTEKHCPELECHQPQTCNPREGCLPPTRLSVGSQCTDSNICTEFDSCNSEGRCIGQPRCKSANECVNDGFCNPDNGSCVAPPNYYKVYGTPCEKNGMCNFGECEH